MKVNLGGISYDDFINYIAETFIIKNSFINYRTYYYEFMNSDVSSIYEFMTKKGFDPKN